MQRLWKWDTPDTPESPDTPIVIVDADKLLFNLNDMAEFAKMNGVKLRPHAKTHKTAEIMRLQLERGAVGITVAKIGEAEALADQGCRDILIAYPIVGAPKLRRLYNLAVRIKLSTIVDSLDGAAGLSDFFAARNKQIEVYVKVDSGLHRCGRQPGQDAAELADSIVHLPGIRLVGFLTHAGHAYGAADAQHLLQIGQKEAQSLLDSAARMTEMAASMTAVTSTDLQISVGSTPTVKISGAVPGVTEIRPGNYVFNDMTQVRLGVVPIERCALRVLSQVISRPAPDQVVIDAGAKTLALDRGAHGMEGVPGYGYIVGMPDAVIERLSEEHGVLRINPDAALQIGDLVEIIPNHACPVVNLADELVVVNATGIQAIWRVIAGHKVK